MPVRASLNPLLSICFLMLIGLGEGCVVAALLALRVDNFYDYKVSFKYDPSILVFLSPRSYRSDYWVTSLTQMTRLKLR